MAIAETAKRFEALEAQARVLMSVFMRAGYEAVAPAMIQPAGVFLDVVGEALRARTYVFSDPDGNELCLRPDITVPVCRLHLERHRKADVKAKYCYNGPVFRFQPADAGVAHPREFRQCGLESFGEANREKADTEVLALSLQAIRAAGLAQFSLRIGDIGLFQALMAQIDIPDQWRQRLLHRFWRRDGFRAELHRLSTDPGLSARGLPSQIIADIDPKDAAGALALVEAHLDRQQIEMVGVRTLDEIADRLRAAAFDARQPPLAAETTRLIKDYLAVTAPAKAAGARLKDLMRERGIDMSEALDRYHRRLQLLGQAGVDLSNVKFAADFGRNLEYYTGFVYEVSVPDIGNDSPICGGGRYDGLMRVVGAPADVAAVGGMIHTERLLAAIAATGADA